MEPSRQELDLNESIKQVMQTLPPIIRNYIVQEKYTMVAKGLMTKYGLHIDQGTVVELEVMLLLMGIENPDEFMQALAEKAQLEQQTINNIVQDINAQIFIPLRNEMKREAENAQQPAKPTAPVAPRPANAGVPTYAPRPPVASQPVGVVGPPPQSPTYFRREGNVSQFIRRTGAPVNPQQPPTPTTAVPKPPLPPLPPRQTNQILPPRPVGNNKLLEDHEEPHIDIRDSFPSEVLLQKVQGASLPGTQPPIPVPSSAPLKSLTLPITPSPKPPVPSKPYSSDPYREPFDTP